MRAKRGIHRIPGTMQGLSIADSLNSSKLTTPGFVFDLDQLAESIDCARRVSHAAGSKLLYSLKACAHHVLLEPLSGKLDGFSCSSLFEAIWARDIGGDNITIHNTSPGIRPCDFRQLDGVCDYVTFNSLSQLESNRTALTPGDRYGLRVNPDCSFVQDERYDPCREYSKLGIPLEQLHTAFAQEKALFDPITGLHVHNNCDSDNLDQLLQTVHKLDTHLAEMLERMNWINLGGGYLFDRQDAAEKLAEGVELLRRKYQLEVFIEPGAGIVRACGYLVATVIDLFIRQGKTIAILDTTVNHLPEVFEYQYEPDILGHHEGGSCHYLLAGSSCLAGDLFGEYSFREKITIGQRIIFPYVGAYSLVKANMFNGICLPCVYTHRAETGLSLKRQYKYQDFTRGLIGDVDATE